MDPVMNMKFEAELQGLKDSLRMQESTGKNEERKAMSNDQIYKGWRLLEKGSNKGFWQH